MKKIFYVTFFLFTLGAAAAQDDPGEGRLREKMVEYIQTKLGLTKPEADRFQPVFVEYFRELKKTNREFKGQGLELQQKIVELRLKYREQFKPIIGDKRSNDVFTHERDFIREVQSEIKDRRQERRDGRVNQRNNHKNLAN